jgi:hypothetical protein
MDNLFGVYSGIVIDSTGYENSISKEGVRFIGHVLVKINGITPTLFNESYKAIPSNNVNGSLDLESAARTEVLAYVMQPIVGESSQGIYDANNNTTQATRRVPSKTYKFFSRKLRDSFSENVKKFLNPVNNPYGNNYYPAYPWNTGLGSYSIPEVNTRVLVAFLNGSRSLPIVIGKLPTQDEQKAFFTRSGVFGNAPGQDQNYKYGEPSTESTEVTEGTTIDSEAVIANSPVTPVPATVFSDVVSEADSISSERVANIQKLASGNLTAAQRSALVNRNISIQSRIEVIANTASDQQISRIAPIIARDANKTADIISPPKK